MASVRVNVIANFTGKAVTGLAVLAFTPLYVKLLGIEAYGLVGMFAAIQGMFAVMDLGLGTTLNQRLARLTGSPEPNAQQKMRDLVRTFEVIYGALGVLSGAFVVISAPWTAHHLLHASALPQATVNNAVRLMGIALALQWPVSLYSGALAGTQRQVLWNGLNSSVSVVRSAGAVAALLLLKRTVGVFFGWQVVMAGVNTALCYAAVWHVIPRGDAPARFRRELLGESFHFASHLAATSLLTVFITQIDKFLLGYWLPLAELGYYSLATTMSGALFSLIGPVFSATFPRLSQLAAASRTDEVSRLYHKACQLMSFMTFPPAAIAALFAYPLLLAWTGNVDTALHTQRLVPFLVLGTALNGTMNVPYALQLSYGWSAFGFIQNLVLAIVVAPLIVGLIHWFGAPGAASAWFTLEAGATIIGIPIMHRRLLVGEYGRWLLRDILPPLLAVLVVVGAARIFLPVPLASRALSFATLAAVGVIAATAAALSTVFGRQTLQSLRLCGRRAPREQAA